MDSIQIDLKEEFKEFLINKIKEYANKHDIKINKEELTNKDENFLINYIHQNMKDIANDYYSDFLINDSIFEDFVKNKDVLWKIFISNRIEKIRNLNNNKFLFLNKNFFVDTFFLNEKLIKKENLNISSKNKIGFYSEYRLINILNIDNSFDIKQFIENTLQTDNLFFLRDFFEEITKELITIEREIDFENFKLIFNFKTSIKTEEDFIKSFFDYLSKKENSFIKSNWEKLMEEKKWNKEFINNVLSKIYFNIRKVAYKLIEFYKDILTNNFIDNPKYERERKLLELKNKFLSSILDLVNNDNLMQFLETEINNENFKDFFNFCLETSYFRINTLLKYEAFLTSKEIENLILLKKKLSNEDFEKSFIPFTNIKDDKIYLFKEDIDNIYKPYSNRINKYEERYHKFIDMINHFKTENYIFLLEDLNSKEQKELIRYINSRLFEDYIKGDKEFFKKRSYTLLDGLTFYESLFPTEFTFFLLIESDYILFQMLKKFEIQNTLEEPVKNKFLTNLKKLIKKDEVTKTIIKTLGKFPYKQGTEKYEGINYLKKEYAKPISLCENPLQEKINTLIAKELLIKKIEKIEKNKDINSQNNDNLTIK